VRFAAITLCVASQRVFVVVVVVVVVYFVIDSVRELLDIPCVCVCVCMCVFAVRWGDLGPSIKLFWAAEHKQGLFRQHNAP
jgi:hypothetical protein